jgi:hypothetical protein
MRKYCNQHHQSQLDYHIENEVLLNAKKYMNGTTYQEVGFQTL